MSEKTVVPVLENMWKVKDGKIYLCGSICEDCGEPYFPAKDVPFCACCGSEKIVPLDIKGTGIVDNMVTIDYPPAGGFYRGPVPFTELVVKMDDDVMVPGHLTGADKEDVHIGDRVEVVIETLFETEKEIIESYKFKPVK